MEPPPIERIEKSVNDCYNSTALLTIHDLHLRLPSTPSRGWGQGKLLDTAEEDYFNQDDDDEEHIPIVSTPPPRGMLTGKRKRPPRNTGIPVRAPPKPPFNGIPRTPPLGSLVDYGGGDGDDMVGAENVAPSQTQTLGRVSPIRSDFVAVGFPPFPRAPGAVTRTGTEPPASSRIAHQQVTLTNAINPEDDSDILEELSKGRRDAPPAHLGHGRCRRGREAPPCGARRRG